MPLPPLMTLDRPPSWVNRAGRVDRSACIEVRASEVWRSCSNMRPARTFKGRLAAGTVTMHLRWLLALVDKRVPLAMQGDRRTAKSNAMKHRCIIKGKPIREQLWPFNPNRGASRSKLLGLWDGSEVEFQHIGPWQQELRIERWLRKPRSRAKTNNAASRLPNAECRVPPSPPAHQHFLICPRCEQKFSKLFMVLCTHQEVADAELAEGWIARCDARHAAAGKSMSREIMRMRARLIDRYGLLFRNRRLVCRTCLGMRYGQVRKESRREDTYYRDKVRRDEARGYETNLPR